MPRIIDCLCASHATAVEDQWPSDENLFGLVEGCRDCYLRTSPHMVGGSLSIRSLPTLSNPDYDRITACHEAAHAVLAVVTGHPVNYVRIEPRTDDLQLGMGGHVNVGRYSVPLEDHLAMLWAGQQAQLRWLIERGVNTAANRVDVRNLGSHDTTTVRQNIAGRPVAADLGRDRCEELLDRHWSTISGVADELARTFYLSGAQVEAYAGAVA